MKDKMKYFFIAVSLLICVDFFTHSQSFSYQEYSSNQSDTLSLQFDQHSTYLSDGFDFPVGKPDAAGYYNAQQFLEVNHSFGGNLHLGEDWNGNGGGNSDLGDTVYTISNGVVSFSDDLGGGWGLVTTIIHKHTQKDSTFYVESLYGHFKECFVRQGEWIKRGSPLGLIGNLNGQMYAHLHFELRSMISLGVGGGYGENGLGYLHPTAFILNNRPK
jgi:murein DD-endopeptidase MepM/ murein hydrolase activator NlpD